MPPIGAEHGLRHNSVGFPWPTQGSASRCTPYLNDRAIAQLDLSECGRDEQVLGQRSFFARSCGPHPRLGRQLPDADRAAFADRDEVLAIGAERHGERRATVS